MNQNITFTTSSVNRPVLTKAREHLELAKIAKTQPAELPPHIAENYEIDIAFGNGGYLNKDSGAKVVALKHKYKDSIVLAFSSLDLNRTEGFDDTDDVKSGAKEQWFSIKNDVAEYQKNLPKGSKIEKVGPSLGGSLVQRSIYEDKSPNNRHSNHLEIRGYAYDSIGAADHIENYDPNRVQGEDLTHLMVAENDLHNISGSHVGNKIHAVAPSHVVEVASHNNDSMQMSIDEALATGHGYQENYVPDGEVNSISGAGAKVVLSLGNIFGHYIPNYLDNARTIVNKIMQQQKQQAHPIPSTSPSGFSGKGLRGVGDPEVKRQNNFSDDANIMLDQAARDADGMAEEMVATARQNPGANQGMINKTKDDISLAIRRVLLDINPELNPQHRQQIVAQRPDLFSQPRLRPLGDTDMDSVFGEISTTIQNERASLGSKTNEREMVKKHVNKNLHRIKFDEKPESLENMFAQNSQTERRTQQDFAKQVEAKMPKNLFDVKPTQTPDFGDGLNFKQDVAQSQSTLDRLFGKKWRF